MDSPNGGRTDFPTISRYDRLPDLVKTAYNNKPRKGKKLPNFCVFCKNNGEAEDVYNSHVTKDTEGLVVCPALYIYVCPICHNTGPKAHTIKHCPYNPEKLKKQMELNKIWAEYRDKEEKKPTDPPEYKSGFSPNINSGCESPLSWNINASFFASEERNLYSPRERSPNRSSRSSTMSSVGGSSLSSVEGSTSSFLWSPAPPSVEHISPVACDNDSFYSGGRQQQQLGWQQQQLQRERQQQLARQHQHQLQRQLWQQQERQQQQQQQERQRQNQLERQLQQQLERWRQQQQIDRQLEQNNRVATTDDQSSWFIHNLVELAKLEC